MAGTLSSKFAMKLHCLNVHTSTYKQTTIDTEHIIYNHSFSNITNSKSAIDSGMYEA